MQNYKFLLVAVMVFMVNTHIHTHLQPPSAVASSSRQK